MRYLPGGVKSGFTPYDPEDVERRLFRVKGKRNVQIMEVRFSSQFTFNISCVDYARFRSLFHP